MSSTSTIQPWLAPVLSLILLFCCACEKEDQLTEIITNEIEDCRYAFADHLPPIYGAWETKIIIDQETGDSTFYEPGEGHQGFMLKDRCSDSFELRNDGIFVHYYASSGRFCAEITGGNWVYENMRITFYSLGDTIPRPVLSLEEKELVMEDTINFRASEVIMRKVN